MAEGASLEGWLGVGDQYDGGENFIGTEVEMYSDGPYAGEWENVARWLERFDSKRVRLTVEILDG